MELHWKSILICIILLLFSIQDIRKKMLNSRTLFAFAIIAVMISIFVQDVSWAERVLGLLTGLFFILISKLTSGQIGIGDGLLISITGFALGFWNNFWMICYGFFLVAIYSILLLIICWSNKKRKIPFIPFLFLSYTGMYLLEFLTP